jgi:hypothetical protein
MAAEPRHTGLTHARPLQTGAAIEVADVRFTNRQEATATVVEEVAVPLAGAAELKATETIKPVE